jgi:hypothetical protein
MFSGSRISRGVVLSCIAPGSAASCRKRDDGNRAWRNGHQTTGERKTECMKLWLPPAAKQISGAFFANLCHRIPPAPIQAFWSGKPKIQSSVGLSNCKT